MVTAEETEDDNNGFATDGGAPLARFGVGITKKPLRLPVGPAVSIDNRVTIGVWIIVVLAIQTVMFGAWWVVEWRDTKDGSEMLRRLPRLLAQTAALQLVASVACMRTLVLNGRRTYAGLFPCVLPALSLVVFVVCLGEAYASFFSLCNATVPIAGPQASPRSNLLVASVVVSAVLVFLFACPQRRPFYMRPRADSNEISAYLIENNESTGEVNNNDESTPISAPGDTMEHNLLDSPESSASWLSRATFSWLSESMRLGGTRRMEYTDLYRLAAEDNPVSCWRRYQRHRKSDRSLLVALGLTLAPELFLQLTFSVIMCAIQFSGPFFLQRILRTIQHLKQHRDTGEPMPPGVIRRAYLDAVGLLVFTLLTSLLASQVMWLGRHIGMRIKGVIIAEMSSKTLRRRDKGSYARVPNNSSNKKNEQEPQPQIAADGKIMNLLTADFQRVVEVSTCLDRVYAMPLTLALGMWYMYRVLGASALYGMSVAAVYVPLTRIMYRYLTRLENATTALSDDRISAISEVLHGIMAVKLFGWESGFSANIDKKREQQLQSQWRVYLFMTLIHSIALVGPMLILIVMFAVYVIVLGNSMTAEIAFTTISVFQVIRLVLERMPGFFSWATNATVSLGRIDAYLQQPQVQALESRVVLQSRESSVLGFESASLEWTVTPLPVAKNSNTISSNATTTPALVSSTAATAVLSDDEETPLLDAPVSPSPTTLQTNNPQEEDLVSFSLENIDVRFPLGGLSIVAGPTGSGKSSLLSALVGEMTLTKGRVLLPTANPWEIVAENPKYKDILALSDEGLAIRDVAYVAQEAWLRNATIRENILFGEPYNRERYEEVLRVCALKPDLRILVAGDESEIGERGITLSGGQKQRVALARAVYSSRRILLIDDCLSAVDAHTGKHILMECLLNKSQLMQGRTCILVTHHLSMCLPFANYLLIMHEGRVALQGTPENLKRRGMLERIVAELESFKRVVKSDGSSDTENASTKNEDGHGEIVSRRIRTKAADLPPVHSLAEFSRKSASTEKNLMKHINDRKSEDEYNAERMQIIAEQRRLDPTHNLMSALEGTLTQVEEREEGHVKFEVWQTYLSACGSESFWFTSILMLILWQAVVVMQDYWIRVWVASSSSSSGANSSSSTSSNNAVHELTEDAAPMYWLSVYIAIGLVSICIRVMLKYYTFSGAISASRTIHRRLLGAVIHATPRFFHATPFGRIISRFSREMLSTDETTMDMLLWWASDIVAVISVFTIVMAVTPAFIFVAVLVVATYMSIGYYYLNASRELKRLESNSMTPLLSLFSELILGVATIRAFNTKHYYLKEAINQIKAQNRPFYMVWSALRWLTVRIDLASATVSFTCALCIIMSLDWIDPGLAGFALMYSLSFSERMMYVIRNFSDNELNMNAIERIMQYMDVAQEASLHSSTRHRPPPTWPESGSLHIKNLVVEYTPGVPVLHSISLSVAHGEKIGIMGRTGAGKSSLAMALLRSIEATKGRIVLDGVNIAKIGLEDLRRNVTVILQDPVLFNGTIRFNLDPFNEHSDEVLWDALRRTHLVREHNAPTTGSTKPNASETSDNVGDGDGGDGPILKRLSGIFNSLDAEIKENGKNLSVGQRQLVAMARALVRRSKMIIMDEGTASIDFHWDDRLQQTIRGPEFANSTLLCIAHRLRTIIDYDRILVLDKGNVAEFDTPRRLLENRGGIFRNMCENSGEFEHLYAVANRSQSTSGDRGMASISGSSPTSPW
ncbi:hypothetical protein IWW48_003965 [Coemansia sp. RSA 1200]|nr:hypothetical protein IWW48_003965 [Coemansia sp. RSA 1200]